MQEHNTINPELATVSNQALQSPSDIAAGGIWKSEPILVGIDPCRKIVFPEPETRPSIRSFNEWRARGYYPSVKIGKRVFLDPVQVRRALDKRFTIEATI